MNPIASALALLRVCSVEPISHQLNTLSRGYPLQWISHLQRQQQLHIPGGISPLREFYLGNEECLYVFATMVLEQIRWKTRTGSEQEGYALFHAWCELGSSMNILDIPGTPDELRDFQQLYEWQHCYYSDVNHQIARSIGTFLIQRLPLAFRPFGWTTLFALLDARVRDALGFLHPPASVCSAVSESLHLYQRLTSQRPKIMLNDPTLDGRTWLLQEYSTFDPIDFLLLVLCFARSAPSVIPMREGEKVQETAFS